MTDDCKYFEDFEQEWLAQSEHLAYCNWANHELRKARAERDDWKRKAEALLRLGAEVDAKLSRAWSPHMDEADPR